MNDIAATQTAAEWKRWLLLILVVAFALRLWGIGYGLPYSYWNDEYHELMRAMQLGAGSFNFARTTKGGFYFVLFFEYGIYYVTLRLAGAVANAREFAELFARDPSMFYLIGRATAAVLGCATIAAIFWIGRSAYSIVAGLVAAFLMTVNVLHVDLSHRIGVDVPMTAFAAFSLYFAVRVAEGGQRRDYVFAALFAALATTTKLPGILLIPSLLIAHTYAVSRLGGTGRKWFGSGSLWLAAALFAGVLLLTNPGFVVHTSLESHISGPATDSIESEESDADDLAPGVRPNLYVFYLGAILDSMGWPLFVVSLLGFFWAFWKRSRADLILVPYALLNYLAIANTASANLYYPRYALPIIAVLVVLAGRLIAELALALPHRRPWATAVAVALLAAWPLWQAVAFDYTLMQKDTRTLAKEWFEANVPAGSKVLIEGGKTGPKRESVHLSDSRDSLERRIAYWKKVEPRQAKFLEFKLAAHEGGGYDLELVRLQSIAGLNEYATAGIEYFVVRPASFEGSRKAGSAAGELLDALRAHPQSVLLRRFEPKARFQPGVIVEIYRLQSASKDDAG